MNDCYPVISSSLIINSVSETKLIALDPATINLFELNTVGIVILSLCNGKRNLTEVQESVKSVCLAAGMEFSGELFLSFIEELTAKGWIIKESSAQEGAMIIDQLENPALFSFNPELKMVTDMNEGFFSKIFVDV